MAPWTTPDISLITQSLNDLLTSALAKAPNPPLNIPHFNCQVNCAGPETARKGAECQLTLYLLHVGRDATWRNTPRDGPMAHLNRAQPLSLNLHYLLTAWADKNFTEEQQAMSIALQCFHSNPIYRPPGTNEEFTISLEADTIEEMSRLWQAFNTPIRLSCLVKVGVVFITPAEVDPPPFRPPGVANIAVGPITADGPRLDPPEALVVQPAAAADPATVTLAAGPAVAVGGSSLSILADGLDAPAAFDLILSTADGAKSWTVTPWVGKPISPGQIDITLPAAYADPASASPAPPTATPAPGAYRLAASRTAPAPATLSRPVPIVIAARIDSLAAPASPTGVYTLAGAGFVAGATRLTVNGADLTAVTSGPPGPGRFLVDPAGAKITFALATPGAFPLAVLVNGVPCVAGWST